MKTEFVKVEDLIKSEVNDNSIPKSPLPLQVIPNYMGINLCSVDALSWTRKDDGQLVNLTIHFLPTE